MRRNNIIKRVGLCALVAALVGTVAGVEATEERREYLRHVRQTLLASPIYQQSGRPVPLSLNECLRLAVEHQSHIASADHGIDASEAQRMEATARWWPIFDYEYRTAPVPKNVSNAAGNFFSGRLSWFHSLSLKVGLPVYAFGKLSTLEHLADQGVLAARQKKLKETTSVAAKVRTLYYGVQLAEELAHVSEEAIERLTERIDLSREDAIKKRVSPIEKLRLQLLRAEIEKRLAEGRVKQRLALEGLRIQVGLPEGTPVAPSPSLVARNVALHSVEHYIREAEVQRPDAQLVDIGVAAKRLEYQLEKKKQLPDIGVGGFLDVGRTVGSITGITSTDDFNHPFRYTRAGIGVQLKGRFDPHGGTARVRKKRSEYYQVSLQRTLAKRGIALEVRKAFLEARSAQEQMIRTEESSSVARRMFFLAKSNSDIGLGESRDYAEAVQFLLLTRLQYYESMFHWNNALGTLDEKIGVVPYVTALDAIPELRSRIVPVSAE